MKRTELEIYLYCKNKIEAYEDVLNYIGTIRTNGTINKKEIKEQNK